MPWAAALLNVFRRSMAAHEGRVGPLRTPVHVPRGRPPRAAKDAATPQGLDEGVDRATEGGGRGDEILVAQFDRLGRTSASAFLDHPDETKQRLGLPASGVLEFSDLEADRLVYSNLWLDRCSLIVDRFHQLFDGNSIETGQSAEPFAP